MTGNGPETAGSGRARSFAAPPAEFDPLTAPAEELARHGLPRRPDHGREPYLAGRWAEVMGRGLSIVAAELEVAALPPPPTRYGVAGWAGVARKKVQPGNRGTGSIGRVAPGAYDTPATFISAEWVVPEIFQEPPNLEQTLSIWVGIDGFPEADQHPIWEPTSQQVIRGGVTYAYDFQLKEFRWQARAEWYTGEAGVAAQVTNLPVYPGHTIGVVMCLAGQREATVFLANLSLGHGTSVAVNAPGPHVHSTGATVEWMVSGFEQESHLPFMPVTFEGCVAGSLEEVLHLTPEAIVTNMYESDQEFHRGVDVTETRILSPTSAVVDWVGVSKHENPAG